MAKLDKHGMKMVGLKAAAAATENYNTLGFRDDIFYDTETGEVWTRFHASENSWTEYHDSGVKLVCKTNKHMTMQEIADAIYDRVSMEA